MKVALVVPPLRAFNNFRMPTGLMCLAASLRQARPGDEIVIIDECAPDDMQLDRAGLAAVSQRIVEKILGFGPDLAAFTATTPDFYHVNAIAESLKKRQPDLITLVGGPHATLRPREFFEHCRAMDFVLTGEGDLLFPEFVNALEAGADLPGCGVWRREKGRIIEGEHPERIANLDSLPLPAYDLIDMKRYAAPNVKSIRPLLLSSVAVFSSRGCPYNCKFCASISVWGRRVRFFNPIRVVDEIQMLKENYNIAAFFFFDDSFTVNKKHLGAVCSELMRRKINLPWGCQTRVDVVDDQVCETIRQAGCIQLEFGVEAGNERGWRSLGKNINSLQVEMAFDSARRHGLRTLVNFMVNIPGETGQDLDDTCNLIRRIRPTIGITNILTPYPGTPFAEERGGVPIEDYESLTMMEYGRFISFLESKWRVARHSLALDAAARKLNLAMRLSYRR
ncbi:MAG: radical SAM protein, partial [Gemmatimonadota bacterium]|nr:radical SAM protein [Gemmatimonadota bacterium]